MSSSDAAGLAGLWVFLVVLLVVAYYGFIAFALGRVFKKLGEQAWKGWIPIINTVTLFELGGYTALWVVGFFFPVVNFIAGVMLILAINNVNRRLGYGGGFTFLAIFFYPVWVGVAGLSRRGEGGELAPRSESKVKLKFTARAESISTGSYPVLSGQNVASGEYSPPPPPPPASLVDAAQAPSKLEMPVNAPNSTGDWEPIASPTSVETQPAAGNLIGRRMVPPAPNVTGQVTPVPPPPPVGRAASAPEASPWAPDPDPSVPSGVNDTSGPALQPTPLPLPLPPVAVTPEPDSLSGLPVAQAGSAMPSLPQLEEDVRPAPRVESVAAVPQQVVKPTEPAISPAEPPAASEQPNLLAAPYAAEATAINVETSDAVSEDEDDELAATVISSRKQPKWKLVVDGSDPIVLEKSIIVVGRNPALIGEEAQLVALKDPTKTLSKTHAKLVREQDTWVIWDLKSTNGVYLVHANGVEQEIPSGGSAPVTERFILGEFSVRLFKDG